MERKQALIELRDSLKVGRFPFMQAKIVSEKLSSFNRHRALEAFEGSLDGAHSIHGAVIPFHSYAVIWGSDHDGVAVMGADGKIFKGDGMPNPARAWLLAILEALIAQEPTT